MAFKSNFHLHGTQRQVDSTLLHIKSLQNSTFHDAFILRSICPVLQANSGKLKEANSTAREGGQGEPCLADRANPPCPTIRGEPCQPKCGKGFYCKINDPVDIQINGCCFSGTCQYFEMEHASTYQSNNNGANLKQPDSTKEDFGAKLGRPARKTSTTPKATSSIAEPIKQRSFSVLLAELLILQWVKP